MYAEILPIFSRLWWNYTAFFILLLVLLLVLAKTRHKDFIANFLGFYLFFDTFFLQSLRLSFDVWTLNTALPLQFCNVMSIIAAIALVTQWRWSFELLLFFGMIAPLQAIVTPGFAFSYKPYIFSYYVSHCITIATPLFLMLAYEMKPRVHSWWKISGGFALFLVCVGLFNYLAGANYMFLMNPPEVDNPLILGKWPNYVLVWILALQLICLLIYLSCPKDNVSC